MKNPVNQFSDTMGAAMTKVHNDLFEESRKKLESLMASRPECCQQAIRDCIEALRPKEA